MYSISSCPAGAGVAAGEAEDAIARDGGGEVGWVADVVGWVAKVVGWLVDQLPTATDELLTTADEIPSSFRIW